MGFWDEIYENEVSRTLREEFTNLCLDKKWKCSSNISHAEVTELVDVVDSKSTDRKVVGVRVPLSALQILRQHNQLQL